MTSAVATLTLMPDTFPPVLVEAPVQLYGSTGVSNAIMLMFSEPLASATISATNNYLVAEAELTGRSALPVLHSRQDVIDAVFDERYDNITSSSVRSGSDWSGWASGRAAADAARLNLADIAHNSDEPDAQPKSSSKLPVGSRR